MGGPFVRDWNGQSARARDAGSPVWRAALVSSRDAIRRRLRATLAELSDVEVVGEAATGAEALWICADRRPDVAFLDGAMPEMDRGEAVRRLKVLMPEIAVVVLAEGEGATAAIRAGAAASLPASAAPDEVARALTSIREDAVYVGGGEDEAPSVRRDEAAEEPVRITHREREVLTLLSRGLSARQVARRLGISERTVNTHVGHIYRRMGVNNRVDAIREAMRFGLVDLPL